MKIEKLSRSEALNRGALAELVRLGYTVVPLEPTDEQVEAVARALCETQGYDPDRGLNPDSEGYDGGPFWWTRISIARAAYEAAIRDIVNKIKEGASHDSR